MLLPKAIKDNLHFLLAETMAQLQGMDVLLETASESVAQRILDRRGYTCNLKMRIHDACVDTVRHAKKDDTSIASVRAAEAIASDLSRITDICHDCVQMMGKLKRKDSLKRSPNGALLREISTGVSLIEQAIDEDDTRIAVKISKIEERLDQAYEKLYRRHVLEMKKKRRPEDTLISLFMAQRMEEMGDVLRDISEAIMSAQMGQPMHLDRFQSLSTALEDLGLEDASVTPIAETKSGSGISGISNGVDPDYVAIFKDGKKDKLLEEWESVESWHEIYPGLAPKILKYKKQGPNASLLIEHLPGQTFEAILLGENDKALERTLKHLTKTLKSVWTDTRKKKPAAAQHMAQLEKRLPTVLEVHPQFDLSSQAIGKCAVPSLTKKIAVAADMEKHLSAPFSVYIHGDFNLDNIIFDPDSRKIRFIDLHRSTYQDYTQDVSVFMVSTYRQQVFNKRSRQRIQHAALSMYDFAAGFADKHNDPTFKVRLALGLARSFITSTRFILDRTLARNMMMRGTYILDRLAEVPTGKKLNKSAADFSLPLKELFE